MALGSVGGCEGKGRVRLCKVTSGAEKARGGDKEWTHPSAMVPSASAEDVI